MELLRARINFAEKTVHFSGPGTFAAKEQIKSLGAARWNSQLKCWDVRMVSLSLEDLQQRFPLAQFELEGADNREEADSETPAAIAPVEAALPPSVGVAELLYKLRAALQVAFPVKIYLRGVVSKVKRHDSWTYLDLVDEQQSDTKLECLIRSADGDVENSLLRAGFKLEDNLQVMCGVQVGMRTKAGVVSLRIVEFIPEYTLGKLAAERDKTNERLKREGLFDRNRSLRLAFVPRRLGVLTSAKGTVIHDFLASLKEARFGFQLFLCHATVQGDDARVAVLAGLDYLEARGVDAIVLMRGGGSPAELAVFNDYEIARRICLATVPVVSAIGHQEDQSSAQDVSFKACGVPKDVGRFFSDVIVSIRTQFAENVRTVQRESDRLLDREKREVKTAQQLIVERTQNVLNLTAQRLASLRDILPREGRRQLAQRRKDTVLLSQRIYASTEALISRLVVQLRPYLALGRYGTGALERAEERLLAYERLIAAASPATQLARGFAIVRVNAGQTIVTRASELTPAAELSIEFADSSISARVVGETSSK